MVQATDSLSTGTGLAAMGWSEHGDFAGKCPKSMSEACESAPWYVAQVKPNCAAIARRNLLRQGFECFLPLERHTRRQGGRFVAGLRPYFPGYLFISPRGNSAPWRAIRSTQGIARLVSFGAQAASVPCHIIEELQECCDGDGCIRAQQCMNEGDHVEIAQGPLTSFVGRVERLAPPERALVLIDIMGQSARVSLRRSDLRLACCCANN